MTNKLIVRTPSGADTTQAIIDALATGVLSIEAVAELFGTTQSVILQLLNDTRILAQIETRREQLYNQLDVARRLERKALWAVESTVPRLAELAHDDEIAPAARVAAIAELVKISGLRARDRNDQTVERVVVNINTGTETVTIHAAAPPDDRNEDPSLEDTIEQTSEPVVENEDSTSNELQINIKTPKNKINKTMPKAPKLKVTL